MDNEEKSNTEALQENTDAVTDNTKALSDPIATALDLINSLDENTKELNKVRRRYRLTLGLVVCLILVFGFAVVSKHDSEVNNCRRSNDLREQIDEKFGSIAALIPVTPKSQPFLDLLNSDLSRRNCGDVGWL